MKICVPTTGNKGLEESVSAHFGSAPFFTIVDSESNEVEVIDNANQHHSHGQCHPMGSLKGKGIDVVICGGMGRRAVELLNADGIKVYLGQGDTVKQVMAQFQEGQITVLSADGACAGHGCH